MLLLVAAGCSDPASHAQGPRDGIDSATGGTENSADRWLVWARCERVVFMTDDQLDDWRDRGADGFVCQAGDLVGIGGSRDFSAPAEPPSDQEFDLERQIIKTDIVARASQRGLDLYLGFFAVNRGGSEPTPFADWFDDTAWDSRVLPAVERFARAAKALGFVGLALDQELYPLNDGKSASWDWDYAGSKRAENEVRTKVRERGAQIMDRLVAGFPDVELLAYYTYFPETFSALVQEQVNDNAEAYQDSVQLEFWDGMSGAPGYDTITLLNALFYKAPHRGTWNAALRYQYNSLFALLSREFTNWDVAYDRIGESPFAWVSDGETSFEVARPPAAVDEQVRAFAEWGMHRTSANYAFGDTLTEFDYDRYEASMSDASKPAVVDDEAPELEVDDPDPDGDQMTITGTATDDHAVRYVRWMNERGDSGMARMEFEILDGGLNDDFTYEMRWRADGVPTDGGQVTVEAVDIKGLRRTKSVDVRTADG